tara:strand:+ start:219118 stop:219669 length:552 start_codon:yes stop_codon:yes gene_type:complete
MSVTDLFNEMYDNDPEQWTNSAVKLAMSSCKDGDLDRLNNTVVNVNGLTEKFNHIITHMDKEGLYIAEHVFTVMPANSYTNIFDYAANCYKEPHGEDNYMSNYAAYEDLRVQSDKVARSFRRLAPHTQQILSEAMRQLSATLFNSLHVSADIYEEKITKELEGLTFEMDDGALDNSAPKGPKL